MPLLVDLTSSLWLTVFVFGFAVLRQAERLVVRRVKAMKSISCLFNGGTRDRLSGYFALFQRQYSECGGEVEFVYLANVVAQRSVLGTGVDVEIVHLKEKESEAV